MDASTATACSSATAGHLHPGGLNTDLYVQRAGADRAEGSRRRPVIPTPRTCSGPTAHYYEPAGAVSWDVAMTGHAPGLAGRGASRATSCRRPPPTTRATASWYESMGIMVVWMADGTGGRDPFEVAVDEPGLLTHGHLPENDNHGGRARTGPVRRRARSCRRSRTRSRRSRSRTSSTPAATSRVADSVPTVQPGQSITFDNIDRRAARATASGTRSPRARRRATSRPASPTRSPTATCNFDSGELGDRRPADRRHA